MVALSPLSEYRKRHGSYPTDEVLAEFIAIHVSSGEWVEDDGDYYSSKDWDAQN